ncbi:MAG: AAA domain-containing protein [Fimbriimonas sp.]
MSLDDVELRWDEAGPIAEWQAWIDEWQQWASKTRPAFETRALYERLYDLHATLERNPEEVELVAADVLVSFNTVDHPILLNPVRVGFDIERSRISLECLDAPTEVYGDAIRSVFPEAGRSIATARREVSENPDIWAFGETVVDDFAKRFVQGADSDGNFTDGEPLRNQLTARRQRWLILRKRATGLAELADGLLEKFQRDGQVPTPIRPILAEMDETVRSEAVSGGEPDEDEESFFTKPANAEQLAILRNYRRSGCVHVQGPPGTGKTHTIANLIGHFLAEGKSVLVTSEKAQALTVLREKVVGELRPLCVSLVGSNSGEGLKDGMRSMHEKLGHTEQSRIQSDIARLTEARLRTLQEIRKARQTMREILELEHRPVEVRGWRGSPAMAGRYVNERREADGWIPGNLLPESEPPIAQEQFDQLLGLLAEFSGEVVPEVRKYIPPESAVPNPAEVRKLLSDLKELEQSAPPNPSVRNAEIGFLPGGVEQAKEMLALTESALKQLGELDESYRELANQVVETPYLVTFWESMVQNARSIIEADFKLTGETAPYDFQVLGPTTELLSNSKHLLDHVRRTGRAVRKPRLLNRQDKQLFEAVQSKRGLGDEASLTALIHKLEFEEKRDRFRAEIRHAAKSVGLSGYDSRDPERELGRDSALTVALNWVNLFYLPVVQPLAPSGLGADQASAHMAPHLTGNGPVDRMKWWLEAVVRPALVKYLHQEQFNQLDQQLDTLSRVAELWRTSDPSKALADLSQAILTRDIYRYEAEFESVAELRKAAEPVQRRDALLAAIRGRAETLATKLEDGTLEYSTVTGSLDSAWTYALINQELCRRSALSLESTKVELDRLKHQLDSITVQVASARAWAAQHRRVTQPVRSALSRFHEAQRRIGGGHGRRVPEFLKAMRDAMREAKDAFPVWIMPLYDLAKTFDFTRTRFDVVIVDESSQLSAVGLITLLIADSAIVVGDDEQTEPSLAGVSVDLVKGLVTEHLLDFRDRILWSPDSSLYSFAARFGATVGLREHFRCVPQIISFSSRLCYQGRIQALRESRDVTQLPHVVPVKCTYTAVSRIADINESEAMEIASLILACSEQPEYQSQSIGVISLRGSSDSRGEDPQTTRIATLIRQSLGAVGWEKFVARTNFKTGVPPSFQGDERDVVFISMVDDPTGRSGPLSMLSDSTIPGGQFRKRLNVAVSRARNQVFVVHSFSHFEAELREGDVRRRLLEFAYAPDEWLEATMAINPQAESPFEEAVYADLVRLGFTVTPQVNVGSHRIDLVAEDADARVAIECDGDAFHQDAAADLSRQIVLERCGWKFIRIRGSEYYRDPEETIHRVVRELERLNVTPAHEQPTQVEPVGALWQRVRDRATAIRDDLRGGPPITSPTMPEPLTMLGSSPLLETPAPALDILEPERTDAGIPRPVQASSADALLSQPAVEEYAEFDGTDFDDPKYLTAEEIQADLVRIVTVEGPATEATVIDRYRIATGYGRFKGPTREMVISVLRGAADRGILRALPDYPGAGVIVYSMPGQPETRVRTRGPRDLSEVPMGEIVVHATEVILSGASLHDEASFRQILDFFGLKRLTEQARNRLDIAFGLASGDLRVGEGIADDQTNL